MSTSGVFVNLVAHSPAMQSFGIEGIGPTLAAKLTLKW